MDMKTAIQTVLGKYATFTGRAARPEYWWWVLTLVLLNIFLGIFNGAVVSPILGFEMFDSNADNPIGQLVGLLLLLPNLAVAVRRLHDTDRSGWWLLIGLIPLLGFLILLFWLTRAGTPGENRFGAKPAES
jgi:uncharacterized membrane protein YhaH (DUF805 family)